MGRLIFFLLLALAVYLAIRFFRRPVVGSRPSSREGGEAMVHCEHCGLYLPRSEALQAQGHNYCSAEHQRAAGK